MAWGGVYLFFVLSGYLIGHLIVAEVADTNALRVWAFWARRALRTWPPYFLALAANYWFAPSAGPKTPGLGAYVTFTQILFPMNYFIESWSLSIEEMFYFVLPILVIVTIRVAGARWLGWLCVLMMATSYLARAETGYRLHPTTVFDNLFIGVLVAHAEVRGSRWLHAVRRARDALFVAGVGLWLALCLHRPPGLLQFQGYLAVAFGLVLIGALSPGSLGARILSARVWRPIALSSYSAYLSHMFVMRALADARFGEMAVSPAARVAIFAASLFAALAAGWIVYQLIERPALRWREQLVPRPPRATRTSATTGAYSRAG
jgi:peptidoglycan/LPS O-acetylase OafA/YrhL